MDEKRDRGVIMVVEQPSDIVTLEQTGTYNGMYHVLMGRLAPLDGVGPGDLNIESLLVRLKEHGEVKEVVLGMNPTLEGDGTVLHLAEALEEAGIKVTRLARGMPAGSTLAGVVEGCVIGCDTSETECKLVSHRLRLALCRLMG